MALAAGILFLIIPFSPVQAETTISADGRFRWDPGAPTLSFIKDPGRREARPTEIRLPPRPPKAGERKLVFADRGATFCIFDEIVSEVGLHLDRRRGSETAKASVVASEIRLVDSRGHVRWTRKLRDRHLVGTGEAGRAPRLGNDGTLAVLLQDSDPLAKTRPVLLVINSKGVERLALDYTAWTRIDAFALSTGGKTLAVHGLGLIPERETWGNALGYYRTDDQSRWIRALTKKESPPSLAFVHQETDPLVLRKRYENGD